MSLSDEMLAFVRALPEPAMWISSRGDVLGANAGAWAVLGMDRERGVGRSLFDVNGGSAESLRDTMRYWSRTAEPMPGTIVIEGSSGRVEYRCKGSVVLPRTDERPAILLVRLWPRRDQNPFLALNQQIAALNAEIIRRRAVEQALRRTELSLQERVLEAESLNRAKDEFLAILGHELRTPLNAILGWAQILRQGTLPPERHVHAAQVIERNARAQARLIEELLDVSTIVTGKLRLNARQLQPIVVVEAAIDALRPAAEAKGLCLQPVLDPHAGPISGDPDRMQQVCWNLLSNAVKFTPANGSIRIGLQRVGPSVEIVVADDGPGIDPEFLPYVFDRFRQQDASSTRTAGGLGLGLSIVKNIVELHGGTVRAESTPGLGSTFVVRLPRASDPATPVAPVVQAALHSVTDAPVLPELENVRLLVVDDEPDSLELLAVLLERAGAIVDRAGSAREAFASLHAVRPDVVISDIGMPKEDGHAFLRRVRRLDGPLGRVPAIALTAFATLEDRDRALAAGYQVHLAKPVAIAQLLAAVARLVRTHPGR